VTDVFVLGAGSAGCAAAIAAAREGASVLLVDRGGAPGGSSTGALVTPMMPNHIAGEPLTGGIYQEVLDRLARTGDAARFKDGNLGWFNPEMLKIVLEEMLVEAGVRILYHTVLEEFGTLLTPRGKRVFAARVYVDASGDAELAHRAGVPTESGREGRNQPASLRFHLGHVDLRRALDYFRSIGDVEWTDRDDVLLFTTACTPNRRWALTPLFEGAIAEGLLRPEDANYFQIFTVPGRPGEVAFNGPRMDGETDTLDPEALTRIQLEGKAKIKRLTEFCRRRLPGFEKAYIVTIAPMVGVRESRRIVGLYRLTREDVLAARKFPDGIARTNYPIDIHVPGKGMELHPLPPGEYYEIPYRVMVPANRDDMLVAGRCISADFEAQGAMRIIANCYALGEAAGTAAGSGTPPPQVDGASLRTRLRAKGARV